MSIQALYSSPCEACGESIRPGQLIDRDPYTENWMHAECPQDVPRPVCSDCFTQTALNGSCACG